MKRKLFLSAALILLASSAQAQENYLCDFPQNAVIYQNARWFPEELPIKIYIPPIPFADQQAEMYRSLVRKAYTSWSQLAPALRLEFVDVPEQAQIGIVWLEHFPEDKRIWGMALHPVLKRKQQGGGHLSSVTLAIKAQRGTTLGPDEQYFSSEEFLALATHEAGHSLGLPHSLNPDDMMYSYMLRFTANRKWGISSRDVATLYALYKLPRILKRNPCEGELAAKSP